jgi:hypothetical protein
VQNNIYINNPLICFSEERKSRLKRGRAKRPGTYYQEADESPKPSPKPAPTKPQPAKANAEINKAAAKPQPATQKPIAASTNSAPASTAAVAAANVETKQIHKVQKEEGAKAKIENNRAKTAIARNAAVDDTSQGRVIPSGAGSPSGKENVFVSSNIAVESHPRDTTIPEGESTAHKSETASKDAPEPREEEPESKYEKLQHGANAQLEEFEHRLRDLDAEETELASKRRKLLEALLAVKIIPVMENSPLFIYLFIYLFL